MDYLNLARSLGKRLKGVGALALLLAFCFHVPGCQNDLDGLRGVEKPGIDPPRARFFFPTGLAITPDGRYLFVTNGNADVKFNGGTVAVVNLTELSARLDARSGPGCRLAAQDAYVLECDESEGLVIPEATVRTGNFPTQVAMLDRKGRLSEDDEAAYEHYRLYVTARGNTTLVYMDALFDGPDPDAGFMCLSCGEGCSSSGKVHDCDDDHVITGPPRDAVFIDTSFPEEPYGVYADEAMGLLYVTHLSEGSVSLFDLSDNDVPVLRQVLTAVLSTDINGRRGGFGVVTLNPGDPESPVYVSNRMAPEVLSFTVQGGAIMGRRCSTGFCHGNVCSMCQEDANCPGSRTCQWDGSKGLFACRGGDSALGAACAGGEECASGFCTMGNTETVCAECSANADCPGEAVCQLDTVAGWSRCTAGTTELGQPCAQGSECESGICNGSVCSLCASDEDCVSEDLRCLRTAIDRTRWAYTCVGGKGIPGARCTIETRNINDMEPLLLTEARLFITAPLGPAEELLSGDMRGMAVGPDGDRLYAVSRIPPGVAVLDTTMEDGRPRNSFIDIIEVCSQPSNIKIRTTLNGWTMAYVTCWATGQVFVLDLEGGEVVSVIASGNGPHDIVFAPNHPWIPDHLRLKAYVTNFAENTISVIDLSDSPTWHKVVGKIGWPERAIDQ